MNVCVLLRGHEITNEIVSPYLLYMSLHICEICKGNTIFSEVEGEKKEKRNKGEKKEHTSLCIEKDRNKGTG